MKLNINYFQKTRAIKNTFSKAFPFLKIEFFKTAHKTGEASSLKNMVKQDIYLEALNPLVKEGLLTIKAKDTVSMVENLFQEFGLSVQVFRKQKNVWIETTKTDQLSLSEQNEMGRKISQPVAHEPVGDRYLEDGQY